MVCMFPTSKSNNPQVLQRCSHTEEKIQQLRRNTVTNLQEEVAVTFKKSSGVGGASRAIPRL